MTFSAKHPITLKSWTLWGAGFCLMGNGFLCALGLVIEPNLITDLAQALADQVGPATQIGMGAGLLGIRRRV